MDVEKGAVASAGQLGQTFHPLPQQMGESGATLTALVSANRSQ